VGSHRRKIQKNIEISIDFKSTACYNCIIDKEEMQVENVIDKLIKEVQQYSLQDIHIVAEQNRKQMEALKMTAGIHNFLIQGSSR